MSHFRTPGPSTRDKRRIAHLRFWLLMIIGSAWVSKGPRRTPGQRRRGSVPGAIRCPECDEIAKRRFNGLYKCRQGHAFELLGNGSLQRVY
jgi:hypothetical protein